MKQNRERNPFNLKIPTAYHPESSWVHIQFSARRRFYKPDVFRLYGVPALKAYSNMCCSLRIMQLKLYTHRDYTKFRTKSLGQVTGNRKGLKKEKIVSP